MLKFYGRKTSINVQKAAWAMGEAGLKWDWIDKDGIVGSIDSREYRKLNPASQIPTLEDDGLLVRQSNAIVRYISKKYAPTKLWPSEYAAYVEASRTMFVGNLLDHNVDEDIDFILVSVKIDYLKEIRYPGTVQIGARVIILGNKSFTTGFGVFLNEECVATSESVNVFFSLKNRTTIPIPDHIRVLLTNDPMLKDKTQNYSRGY